MKTRAEIARFVEKQMSGEYVCEAKVKERRNGKVWDIYASHYGVCELRDLMDFIFDAPPDGEREKVHRS